MSTQVALTERQPSALERSEPTMMDLLQLAIDKEGSIDVIERLANLQLAQQDRLDRVAFSRAMSAFKDEVPVIIRTRVIRGKDKADGTPGNELYKAVALEDVADPIMKALSARRITYRFKTTDLPDGRTRVTCYLRLEGTAYEEEGSSLAAPPDTSGGKDALKGVGSTVSYLEKYTLLASCGVHVHGTDPEAAQVEGVSNDQGAQWLDKIKEAETAPDTMGVWAKAIEFAKGFNPPDYKAMTIFTEARDERLKQLRRGSK